MLLTMPAAETPDVDDVDVNVGVDAPAGSFVGWVLELPPGPQSLALLCSLDAGTLTARERLMVLQAWERQHAWMSAQLQAATVAAAGPEPTTVDDWARDEVAAALRLSTGAARNKVHLARTLAGPTSAINCGMLCRRHHRLKTFRPWKLKRHADGSVTWHTAAGLVHRVPPKDQRDP